MAHVRDGRPVNQIIHGKPRSQWVTDAARAMIGSTDPAMLYKITRIAGFLSFAPLAKKLFSEHAGFEFTMDEIRDIFNEMNRYVDKLVKQDRAHATVNRAANRRVEEQRETPLDDKIMTESISGATRGWTRDGKRIH